MVSQAEALRSTVEMMDLKPEHTALIACCEGLAEQIDLHPERATLWREYRPAVEFLLSVAEDGADDGQTAFLELVRSPVGVEKKSGKGNAGSGARRGSREARPATDAMAATGSGRRSRASA